MRDDKPETIIESPMPTFSIVMQQLQQRTASAGLNCMQLVELLVNVWDRTYIFTVVDDAMEEKGMYWRMG